MTTHPRNAVRREGPLRVVQAQSGAEVEDFEGIARASTASPGRLPEDGMDDGMEPEPEPELTDPYETLNTYLIRRELACGLWLRSVWVCRIRAPAVRSPQPDGAAGQLASPPDFNAPFPGPF